MLPTMTTGSINRMLDAEEVVGAVIQILTCKKIPGRNYTRYRLLISDGVTSCSFALLGTHLNHLVTNKELENFTIVRVDKYLSCQICNSGLVIIILLNLTVLVPGAEVNVKIGNPINSSILSDISALSDKLEQMQLFSSSPSSETHSTNAEHKSVLHAESGSVPQANSAHTISSLIPYQNEGTSKTPVTNNWGAITTTAGSINRILAGEEVGGAVIQILDHRKFPGSDSLDRYRLLISDGVTCYGFVMLAAQLNDLVTNKELENFTLVRVDRCICNVIQRNHKVIILLNLTVLVPGTVVNQKIGNPTFSAPTAINSSVPKSVHKAESRIIASASQVNGKVAAARFKPYSLSK